MQFMKDCPENVASFFLYNKVTEKGTLRIHINNESNFIWAMLKEREILLYFKQNFIAVRIRDVSSIKF